jgi:hypothetical protein
MFKIVVYPCKASTLKASPDTGENLPTLSKEANGFNLTLSSLEVKCHRWTTTPRPEINATKTALVG